MCVNYLPLTRDRLDHFAVAPTSLEIWPTETWQDYAAPIIRVGPEGGRKGSNPGDLRHGSKKPDSV